MNDAKTRLEGCFLAVFPGLAKEAIAQASVTSVEDWDSVSSVTLLSVIEEEFDVAMLTDDVEELVSFQRIYESLLSKNGETDN